MQALQDKLVGYYVGKKWSYLYYNNNQMGYTNLSGLNEPNDSNDSKCGKWKKWRDETDFEDEDDPSRNFVEGQCVLCCSEVFVQNIRNLVVRPWKWPEAYGWFAWWYACKRKCAETDGEDGPNLPGPGGDPPVPVLSVQVLYRKVLNNQTHFVAKERWLAIR